MKTVDGFNSPHVPAPYTMGGFSLPTLYKIEHLSYYRIYVAMASAVAHQDPAHRSYPAPLRKACTLQSQGACTLQPRGRESLSLACPGEVEVPVFSRSEGYILSGP